MAEYDELKELISLNFRAIKAEQRAEFEVLNINNLEIIKHQKETNGQLQRNKKAIETCKKSVSFFRILQANPFKSVVAFLFVVVIAAKVANLFTFKEIYDAIISIIKSILT